METKEAIDKIKQDLAEVKAQGHTSVVIETLENYLTGLEKDASLSIEYRKLDHQGSLAQYVAQAQTDLVMLKSVLDAGSEALKAILLINGGQLLF